MLTKSKLQQMSDSQLQSYVMDYARQNKMGDTEAADMLQRFQAMREQTPTAPSTGVTKGRNKPRKMGKKYGGGVKTQGYRYGGKACRGRKANYKA